MNARKQSRDSRHIACSDDDESPIKPVSLPVAIIVVTINKHTLSPTIEGRASLTGVKSRYYRCARGSGNNTYIRASWFTFRRYRIAVRSRDRSRETGRKSSRHVEMLFSRKLQSRARAKLSAGIVEKNRPVRSLPRDSRTKLAPVPSSEVDDINGLRGWCIVQV